MLIRGMIAGFAGTVLISVMMLIKGMIGIVPELDPVGMLAAMFGGPIALGWVMHFVIGTVAWGGGYALLYKYLPSNSPVIKGVVFGVLAWIAMMLVIMPIAGKGFFGMEIGVMAPIMTMMLHVIFGAVMGFMFSKQDTDARHHI